MLSAEELNTLRELVRRDAIMTDTRGNFFCASCLTPLLDYIGELTADRDKWKERAQYRSRPCVVFKNEDSNDANH